MPSASTKSENKTSPEVIEPFKQALLVVEKKVRNLEKRKSKLDGYRDKATAGEKLNADQKEAIDKYDAVIQNLEFARELTKQFVTINTESEKLARKQQKRRKLEEQNNELERLRRLLSLQNLLDSMGSESAREHFTAGSHGAVQLAEKDLDQLDELYKIISPSRDSEDGTFKEQLVTSSEHILGYLDGKDKEVIGTTYKDLKNLCATIDDCGYFDNPPPEKQEAEEEEETPETTEEEAPETAKEVQPSAEPEIEAALEPEQPEPLPSSLPAEPTQPAEPELTSQALPADAYNESSYYTQADSTDAQQRPFNEIVSSVQGSFNFLQESQIELESPHMDPAVVSAHLTRPPPPLASDPAVVSAHLTRPPQLSGPASYNTGFGEELTQATTQPDGEQLSAAATTATNQTQQNISFMDPQTMDSTYTGQDYSQTLLTSTLQNRAIHSVTDQSYGQSMVSSSSSQQHPTRSQSVPDATADGPSAGPTTIPMPAQQVAGSYAQASSAQLAGTYAQASGGGQEKKPFSMNVNAAVFQSVYSSRGGSGGEEDGTAEDDKTSDGQGGGGFGGSGFGRPGSGNRGGGGRGGRGGPRGGAGVNNGFPRGGSARGTPFNNRGGFGNNGNRGNGRGAYQGYPPRSDYRPEGGYQGFNNGFGLHKRGGAMRGGGAPRGGNNNGRGARGGGGFGGGNRMPTPAPAPQQTAA